MRRLPTSAWALMAANLVPLAGVVALDWDLGAIMLLFWAENAVIGGYHLLRMALVTGKLGILLVPFFSIHFGLFTLVHGAFVVGIFVVDATSEADALAQVRALLPAVLWGALALVVSHGVSFVVNFLRGGERQRMREAVASLRFRKTGPGSWSADVSEDDLASGRHTRGFTDLGRLMSAPYRRVVVLHLTIMGGALLLAFLGTPTPALVLLVALKTGVDLWAHLRERRQQATPAPAAASTAEPEPA